jgi:phosphate transport system substrate-binding protein
MRLLLGLALLVSSAALQACSQTDSTPHPPVILHVGGSDSMQLLARDLGDAYHQAHPYATVELRGGNSTSALAEFARGSLDIALVSRNPRSDELKQPPARVVEIARDGIVVVVHPSNPLTKLSRDDLAKIFSGEILNWSALTGQASKGSDDSIQVISREEGSGTRSVFEQNIMTGRRVTLTALIQPSSRDVLKFVESNPNAIGYAAFNLWNRNSTARVLSIDDVAPSLASIQSSTYPLMQTYYFVVPVEASPDIADFVDFVLSPLARKVISSRAALPR